MKYVRKITPAPLSDAEGLESWLEDLALQGLYLKTFRPLFCTFIPGPVKKTATAWSHAASARMTTRPAPCWSCTRSSAGTMRARRTMPC